MYAQLFGFLLFACQIILNESSIDIDENVNFVGKNNSETPSTNQPSTLPEGYVTFPNLNVAYKYHEVGTTWNAARDLCVEEGAHLAIADTVEKMSLINSLKTHQALKWTHVGIYHLNTTNQWVRIDNDLPLTSLPWLDGSPDGDGDCAGMGIWTRVLLDYECDAYAEWFACEIPV